MPIDKRILIASRSAATLPVLAAALTGVPGIVCTTKIVSNGHPDPLHDVSPRPDLLLLRFDTEHLAELAALAEKADSGRPPLIVVGPAGSAEAFRLAVRAGARDFLSEPVVRKELIASVERLLAESKVSAAATDGEITALVGAAGGVGTSFLACNFAHSLATEAKDEVVLVDLDLTYAPLASFFDVHPERGLLEALEQVESLDEHALPGYVGKHRSGVHVIGATGNIAALTRDVHLGRFAMLLKVLKTQYRQVVLDVPYCMDAVNATALSSAQHVLVVLQQSVVQVRNAVRLVNILTGEIGLPRDTIRAVVNRHQKKLTVASEDVERALRLGPVFTVPSAYGPAVTSLDSGVPLLEGDRGSAVGRAVMALHDELRGVQRPGRGLLRRALPIFAKD